MQKTEIDEIERLAKSLTVDEDEIYYSLRYGFKRPSEVGIEGWSSSLPDEITNWLSKSPDVTLKLIAYVRRLDETLECFYQHLDTFGTIAGGTRGEMDSQEKCFRLYHEVKALKEASDAQD